MKKTVIVNFILDESGSMSSIKEATIAGFNKYLTDLKKDESVETLFTLTKFDSTGIRTPYVMKPIREVPLLNSDTYMPGQNTPLYDAVVETVNKVEKEIKDDQGIIVAIMTDGEENASHKHNEQCLKDLIHKLDHKGNWTFLYMGANQDAWSNASRLGILRGNTMQWDATERGTQHAFYAASASNANYNAQVAKGGILRSANYFGNDPEVDKK